MLETGFDMMLAFHQAAYLLGGGLVMLIGGAILLHTLHTYLYALRVPAVITGVRRDGKMLFPVYKYMMPDGDTYETVSDTGSGFVKGKETGRQVTIYVFAEDPQGIRTELHVTVFIGLVFLIPGVILVCNGIFAFPHTPMTWIASAVFLFMAAQRLKKVILPPDARLGKEGFRTQMRKRRSGRFLAMELTTMEAFLQTPAGRQAFADEEKSRLIVVPFLFVFGFGALVFAWNMGTDLRALTLHGQRTAGVIDSFEAYRSNDNQTTYRAKVAFNDARGDRHVFAAKTAASVPLGRVGDPVKVLYLPDAPAKSAIIDSGQWINALWPAMLALLGVGTLAGAWSAWQKGRYR
jgi:hypothetical protein